MVINITMLEWQDLVRLESKLFENSHSFYFANEEIKGGKIQKFSVYELYFRFKS